VPVAWRKPGTRRPSRKYSVVMLNCHSRTDATTTPSRVIHPRCSAVGFAIVLGSDSKAGADTKRVNVRSAATSPATCEKTDGGYQSGYQWHFGGVRIDAMITSIWIALSASGQPAPFIGYFFTRRALVEEYQSHFGHSLIEAGYRPVKAQLVWDWERSAGDADRQALTAQP